MKVVYFSGSGNFGDELNPWLWPRIFPSLSSYGGPDHSFVGIGTILDDRIPSGPVTIFGAGVRNPRTVPPIAHQWDLRFVRGPLSARVLGCPSITDPALCLRLLELPAPAKSNEIGFMPHFLTEAASGPWRVVCRMAGLKYISPTGPIESTIAEIRACRALLTEAMHGAIVADMYRVPWVHVRIWAHTKEGEGVSDFKWSDWCTSMNFKHTFEAVPMLWPMNAKQAIKLPGVVLALRRARRFVSLTEKQVLCDRLAALRDAVDRLKASYSATSRT